MKRFHIHVGVKNLEESVRFYTTLFGQEPTKQKVDYAKWMLEDPKLNFAISTRANEMGVDHVGIQVENASELTEITERLKKADLGVFDEGETTCCYAESNKAWVKDPDGVSWETFHTTGAVTAYGEDTSKLARPAPEPEEPRAACCG